MMIDPLQVDTDFLKCDKTAFLSSCGQAAITLRTEKEIDVLIKISNEYAE